MFSTKPYLITGGGGGGGYISAKLNASDFAMSI